MGLLYHGLAVGPMSVVAPVTAVCAVLVPVSAGVACAIVAVALIVRGSP